MRTKSAAIVVIGNEILSGKVVDSNSVFAAKELRSIGVSLERIIVIPDDVEVIATVVGRYRSRYDVVFTSGGVGPTHDDVTMLGVARGLGVGISHHPEVVDALRQFGELTPAHLKMAEVPQGAEAIFAGVIRFPVIRVENVYVLPGIPEIFCEKFVALKELFLDAPYFLRTIYLRDIETAIAPQLNNTLSAFPALQLGSYPTLGNHEYRVRVTLESKNRDYVERALEHLISQLSPAAIVRVEKEEER